MRQRKEPGGRDQRRRSPALCWIVAGILISLTTSTGWAQLRIPLDVVVPAGLTGPVPLTAGVPLPPRSDYQPEAFTVVGPSGPVPSQVRAAVRAGLNASVTWLLVDFQALPGAAYTLELGVPPPPAVAVTVVGRPGGGYVVDTGAGRYEVLPNSDLLGSIAVAGIPLVDGATWGVAARPASIEVVESGPLRAMLRVRSQAAVSGLDLVARLHFYAGLPLARVQLTLINHNRCPYGWEAPGSDNGVCGVQATQPACNGLSSAGSIDVEDVTWALQLAAPGGPEEVIYQDSSGTTNWNHYLGRGPRMQSGVVRRGFVHLRNGVEIASGDVAEGTLTAGGVRFDVAWFRELFPKALRARSGQLEFGILPGEFARAHRLRAGEQTTHEVWVGLNPNITAPWGARASPSFDWLRATHALGYVGPRIAGQFDEYEDYIDAQFETDRPNRLDCNNDVGECARSVSDAQQSWDYFGWIDFGDLPTDFEHPFSPYNLKYDVNLGFVHQALRTSEPNWWHWAQISNRHFADIDILHARARGPLAPRQWYEGGAYGHSLHNEIGLTNPHRNCNNPAPDTYWGGAGLAAWALLTGDDVIREAAVELADNTLWRLRNSSDTFCDAGAWGGGNGEGYAILDVNARAVANSQRIVLWAWKLTGDQAYLDGAAGAAAWAACERANLQCGSWPDALLARSMGEYLVAVEDAGQTPHPDALPALRRTLSTMADNLAYSPDRSRAWFNGCTGAEINAWMFLAADAFALGYAVTGEQSWLLDRALPSFNTASADPYYLGDASHYHSSKELVNAVSAGTIFLHFASIGTPTPTPTPAVFGVSGTINYYSNDLPVNRAMVQLQGPAADTAQTAGTGQFAFPGIGAGTWQIRPAKWGDAGDGISALDAVYTLQAAIGLRTLDREQQLACDVTGNGMLSALDAALILQHVVGTISHFPVAQTCGSDWTFVPVPAPASNQQVIQPQVGEVSCQPGEIIFSPLVHQADDQNFRALLFGDCTGNWQPSE